MDKKRARNAFGITDAGGDISGGVVHRVPVDLYKALTSDLKAPKPFGSRSPKKA